MTRYASELAKAFGYLYPSEVEMLYDISAGLKPGSFCVNIGAGAGTSTLAMLENRADLAPNFYSVDVSPGGPLGGHEGERNAFNNVGLGHLIPKQILGDSKELAFEPPFMRMRIDYLFVDGDHSEDGIAGDINGWWPLVAPGGYVLFHDYENPERANKWPFVKPVVDRLIPRKDFIVLVDTLAVYRKGRKETTINEAKSKS